MKSIITLIFLISVAIAAGRRSRIVNHGEVAKEKEFSYQVSLRDDHGHFCGGSLISRNHVLTAAHCIQDFVDYKGLFLENKAEIFVVEVGMIRLGCGKTHRITRVSYHPDYNHTEFQNDVAIVHLAEPVELSDSVSIINLPEANSTLPAGTEVIVSGFGAEDSGGDPSPVLKMTDSKIVSIPDCQKHHDQLLVVGNICAVKGKDYGICSGDSGGPLVDKTKTTLIGVVSAGKAKDCKGGDPGIYAEVSRFIPYINSELNYDPEYSESGVENPAINLNYENENRFSALLEKPCDE